MNKEYGLFNKDGELVDRVTASQLAEKYYTVTSTIYLAEKKNRLLSKKYTVKYIGDIRKPNRKEIAKAKAEAKKRMPSKEQKHVDYLTKMLTLHGNTLSAIKPTKKMLNALAERGFNVDVTVYEHKDYKETDYILSVR